MDSLKGHLLLANGNLFDPNFRRTVVFLAEHSEEGAMGVVLNRPSEILVAEAVPPLADVVGGDEPLFIGGPVQPNDVLVMATFEDPGSSAVVADGVGFLSGEIDEDSFRSVRDVRVFAGYSGWGSGQLEFEMAEDSWITEPALAEDAFTVDPEGLWSAVLRRKGGQFALLATMPYDPQLN
jgi:putative transcriptional regulator